MYIEPGVPLSGLDKLSRSIIVRDVEPEAVRNCSRDTLTEAERVSTHKIRAFSVRVIQGVEEQRG